MSYFGIAILPILKGGGMAGKDIIMVRQKELKRLHVIHKVIEGELTQGEAAKIISLSERQGIEGT